MGLTLKSPAKINLGLSILRKLPNDYHEVKTIYVQISLFDAIILEESNKNSIKVYCEDKNIPVDETNLVYKAAGLIKKTKEINSGIKIFLKKKIPVGAGLGGGSADAAATLLGLNHLWHLNLSLGQLINLAKTIGADVPYHLVGGLQLEVQGGERAGQFTALGQLPACSILVCFPDIEIASKQAYSQVEYHQIGKNNLSLLIKAIRNKDLNGIATSLHNDFEHWTFKKYPVIRKIKDEMLKYGALGSLMSGKGSAVFGIFDNLKKAKVAQKLLGESFKVIFLVKPYYD